MTTVETVLATVDWAHCTMVNYGEDSGYAMDEEHAAPGSSKGLFARYLRGDTSPSERQLQWYGPLGGAYDRFHHPIYKVLAQPHMEGHKDQHLEDERRFFLLQGLAIALECKILRTDMGFLTLRPATPRLTRDLAVQADGNALTALLALAMNARHDEPGHAIDAAVRATQCLIFTLARGEFSAVGRLLWVRIRQQVIDVLRREDGNVIDSASIDLLGTVAEIRQLLERRGCLSGANSIKTRKLLRAVLAGAEGHALLARLTPDVVPLVDSLRSRQLRRERLDLDAAPRGRFNYQGKLGAGGREVLEGALQDYCLVG